MPFANIKIPQAALSRAQKTEIVHRLTALSPNISAKRHDRIRWC
jgi:phenylpyruvate tautomerase PptA (4-oxalocrotonate tautomerase family)